MPQRGYSKAFAVGLVVCVGVPAPLVPPSIAFVIWGVNSEQSIARLFAAGVIPGLLMAASMMVICYLHAQRRNAGGSDDHCLYSGRYTDVLG